jgi:hypothetical protein
LAKVGVESAQVVDFHVNFSYFNIAQTQARRVFPLAVHLHWAANHNAKNGSIGPDFQVQDFPGLALDRHFHGTAANLTIDDEALRGLGGVHRQFESLPTKWTLNVFRLLHLPDQRKVVTIGQLDWSVIETMSTQWHTACCQFCGRLYE